MDVEDEVDPDVSRRLLGGTKADSPAPLYGRLRTRRAHAYPAHRARLGTPRTSSVFATPRVEEWLNLLKRSRSSGFNDDPARSLEDTKLAWVHYERLEPGDKDNARVVGVFLSWLLDHQNDVSDGIFLDLYNRLAPKNRTLANHKAALSKLLRRGEVKLATRLYAQAIEGLDQTSAQILSARFLVLLWEHEEWALACDVSRERHTSHTAERGAVEGEWKDLSAKSPHLRRATSVLRFLAERYDTANEGLMMFCAECFDNFLRYTDQLSSKVEVHIQSSQLREYLDELRHNHPQAKALFERLLNKIFEHPRSLGYRNAHPIASFIFREWLTMPQVTPSVSLLRMMALKIRDNLADIEELPENPEFIDLETLVDLWTRHHGTLELDFLTDIMKVWARQGLVAPLERMRSVLSTHPAPFSAKQAAWLCLAFAHASNGDVESTRRAVEETEAYAWEAGEIPDERYLAATILAHARAGDLEAANEALQRTRRIPDLGLSARCFRPVARQYAERGDVAGVRKILDQFDASTGLKRDTPMVLTLIEAHIAAGDVTGAKLVLEGAIPKVERGEIIGSLHNSMVMLLRGQARAAGLDKIVRMLEWLNAKGFSATPFMLTTLLEGVATHQGAVTAKALLQVFGVHVPNLPVVVSHYERLAEHLLREGRHLEVLKVPDMMLSTRFPPSPDINEACRNARVALRESFAAARGTAQKPDEPERKANEPGVVARDSESHISWMEAVASAT